MFHYAGPTEASRRGLECPTLDFISAKRACCVLGFAAISKEELERNGELDSP